MASEHCIDLLLVEDDDDFRETLARRFSRQGYQTSEATTGQAALALCDRREFRVAIIDMVLPGLNGIELLKQLRATHPECEVIMLTGHGTIETAVEAMKSGAYDFLTKPFPLVELEVLVEKAYQHGQLRRENAHLRSVIERSRPQEEMIGNSPAMREVLRLIQLAAPTDKTILIQGESGTGKELVARALHSGSTRGEKPMVVINCAALPESLLESELFGHEKGAFTGASSTKLGLFEVADGGTLFIDEIGELAGSLQAKLLRVLEDGSFRRVGSLKERRVDVRILAATNRDMEVEIREGRFREDLYYRINVMSLTLPPLRERASDIRPLVERFLGPPWEVDLDALAALERYSWPGNIRQLINALERAKILAIDNRISRNNLPAEVLRADSPADCDNETKTEKLAHLQRNHVVDVLRRQRGNKAQAARLLGINRRSLYRLVEKYAISQDEISAP